MKKINKTTYIFLKFLFTFIFLFVVIMWVISNTLEHEPVSYGNVIINTGVFPQLKVSTEEDALNGESTIVSVTNDTDSLINYKMYFTLDKTSTIDRKYIRLNYNGHTYDLSNMNYLEVNNKYYFYLEEGNVDAKSMDPIDVFIWIDKSFDGDVTDSKIYIDFDTLS